MESVFNSKDVLCLFPPGGKRRCCSEYELRSAVEGQSCILLSWNVRWLLFEDFLGYVALGFALDVLMVWYGLRQWLEDFAYRIEIGTGAFALAGILVLSVALMTVGTQALRAAWVNPAYALRDK